MRRNQVLEDTEPIIEEKIIKRLPYILKDLFLGVTDLRKKIDK